MPTFVKCLSECINLYTGNFKNKSEVMRGETWESTKKVYRNDICLVIDDCNDAVNPTLAKWYKILTPNGDVGWICSVYVVGIK